MARKPGPETKLVKKMRDAGAEKYGSRLVTIKYHGDAFSEAGVSDLLVSLDGIFIACEVKSPEASTHKRATVEASIIHALTYGPTLKQRAFVKRMLRSGACAGFAATVPQFMDMLQHAADLGEGIVPRPCWGHNTDPDNLDLYP